MSQMRIFLSHSSQDKAFADALVRALRGAGADVWYDEHNLGTGQLLDAITRELQARPVFIVLLSKAAFASAWVRDECSWAFNLYKREPQRIILPVVAAPIDHSDFNAMLYLEDFRRVEGPGNQPFQPAEAVTRTLQMLALDPPAGGSVPTSPHVLDIVEELIVRGKALHAQDKSSTAIPFFEVATTLAPLHVDAWLNLGACQFDAKLTDEAIASVDQALTVNPNAALAWWVRGTMLVWLGRYVDALTAFDRVLMLAPSEGDGPAIWTYKARAFAGLARFEDALAANDRVLAIIPDNFMVWLERAEYLRALGRQAEADEAERRAREFGG